MRHSLNRFTPGSLYRAQRNLSALLLLCSLCARTSAASITEIDLASKTAWTFRPDADSGGGPAKTIPVPAGGWRLNGFTEATAGTYQRTVTIPALAGETRQVTVIDFEAVNWEATVSAGPDAAHLKQASIHLSAWTPFRVDISPYITPGRTAVISVHVRDRTYFTDSQGHFTVPAGPEWNDRAARGIIRGVSLKVLPEVCIENLFVHPSTETRTLSCSVTVRNASSAAQHVTLKSLLGAAVYLIPTKSTATNAYPVIPPQTVSLAPRESRTVTVGPVKWTLLRSRDWLPNIPFRPDYRAALHQITVTADSTGGHSACSQRVRFGFCSMGQRGTKYTINGTPVNLRGDSLPEGTIGTDAFARLPGFLPPQIGAQSGWPAAVRNYQKLNYNVLRMHQIPCTQYMMDVCDELGMLVIPETAIRGGGIAPENVQERPETFTTHLRELIVRDRNHPSVVKWSLENEIPNAPMPFLRQLYDTCMLNDGSRPCSIDVFDTSPAPDWPNFAVIDHYSQPAGSEDPTGGIDRGARPRGEGEYVWPFGNRAEGPAWFALETRALRRHDNSDLRPYTLIDVWAAVIPGLTPTNFPEPHLPPNSLEQGGRSRLNPLSPWTDPLLTLIQRSFSPLAAFDVEYDKANMHTNGKGEWPTTVPILPGGVTTTRKMEVFNDELAGTDVKLIILPTLKLSDTERQALPDVSMSLQIPVGGHISVNYPLAAPIVLHCTTLEAIVTVWKGGQERYRETLAFNVNPPGKGSATVAYIGTDTVTGGDWIDASGKRAYGSQAFLLPIRAGRMLYQDPAVFLRRVSAISTGTDAAKDDQDETADGEIAWERGQTSTDARIPWSGPGRKAREPVAFSSNALRLFLRVDCYDAAPHQLSLYMMDYFRNGLPVDVDIYDTAGHRLESRKIDGSAIDSGVYVKYRITGSIYISIVTLANREVTVSGMFVDPAL